MQHLIWATSWENLFKPYANNKDADQPAHPCSLISTFVVRCLDSKISLVFMNLASFFSWADHFESYLVANPEYRFSRHVAHFISNSSHCFLVGARFLQDSVSKIVMVWPTTILAKDERQTAVSRAFYTKVGFCHIPMQLYYGHKVKHIWAATWQNKQNDCAPAKIQISLGIRPVLSKSSLSTWRKLGSLATNSAHSEDSDQTGRMPRLIWVFGGRTVTLLVFSCRGSYIQNV